MAKRSFLLSIRSFTARILAGLTIQRPVAENRRPSAQHASADQMNISARFSDLPVLHPRLLWEDIIGAAGAIIDVRTPFQFELAVRDVPGFGSDRLRMTIDPGEVSMSQVERLRRTFERSRLVELAAIAIAGMGLYYAGGHEIQDIALRGSAADYLVDHSGHLLEIAGRSRRSDLTAAFEQRWLRLSKTTSGGFYVCAVEFESLAGQLAFHP